jgi:Uma2 family endonuclease
MSRTATLRRVARKAAAPAAAAPSVPVDALGDERFVIPDLSWESYVALNDAVVERPGLRMIYCDGRLTLLTESLKHGFHSRCLFVLVMGLAQGLKIRWTTAGTATYRRQQKSGGVEGDETFYFGEHAIRMRGADRIDLDAQPPPDLAVEVEVSHSADDAVTIWGRLGVPEVWRFDPIAGTCSFWRRRRDGTYTRIGHSVAFPMLTPDDVLEQMRLADELGPDEWQARLARWVKKVIVPRTQGGK